mgnify:CR=1 FL=1
MSIATHYDTLKIARDAPPEVIRAAYEALCQKLNPDKKAAVSSQVKALEEAFAVLSNLQKRTEHDLWIRQKEPPPADIPATEREAWAKVDKAIAEAASWASFAEKAEKEAKEKSQ